MFKHKKLIIAICSAAVIVVTTVGVAYAHISSSTGSVAYLSSPPASVRLNALESATQVQAFDERQGVTLASAVAVDALVTNTSTFPMNSVSTFPNGSATVPATTVVDSHLIHSDIPQSGRPTNARTATLTFSTPILGVVASTSRLAATDAALGSPTTQYAGNLTWRGLESSSGSNMENNSRGADSFRITGANTLSINLSTYYMDEIRVLTKHPVPIAVNDAFSVNVPDQLSANVLANDSDPGGPPPLTAVLVSNPNPLKAQSVLAGFERLVHVHAVRQRDRYRHVHLQGEGWVRGPLGHRDRHDHAQPVTRRAGRQQLQYRGADAAERQHRRGRDR